MRPYTRIFKTDHDRAIAAGGMTALAVYVALCRIHSDAPLGEKASFRAGKARIARHSGCSVTTAKRMLPLLADEGLITIVSGRRKDRQKDNEENRITLIGIPDSPSKGGATESLGGGATENLGRVSNSELKDPRIKKDPKGSKETSKAGRSADAASAGWIERQIADQLQHQMPYREMMKSLHGEASCL